jgi:peptidoglycan/LPS O-acetylase OafA/YrhL
MRGVAAVAVTLHHIQQAGLAPRGVFVSGYLAVDIFFVLSGFVIAHAYDARIGTSIAATKFIVMRFIRFWPLIFIGVSLGALQISLFDGPLSKEIDYDALPSALLLNAFILPYLYGEGSRMFPTNPPEWSLFYELFINSIYAVTFRWLSTRVLTIIVTLSGLLLVTAIVLHQSAGFGWAKGELSRGVVRVTFSFFVGIIIRRNLPYIASVLPKFPMHYILAATLAVLFLPFRLYGIYDIVIVIIVSPLLVVAGSQALDGGGKGLAVAKWLGDISYPLYAIHAPILFAASYFAPASSVGKWAVGLAVFCFAVGVSPLVQMLFDVPVRGALSRVLLSRRVQASPVQ